MDELVAQQHCLPTAQGGVTSPRALKGQRETEREKQRASGEQRRTGRESKQTPTDWNAETARPLDDDAPARRPRRRQSRRLHGSPTAPSPCRPQEKSRGLRDRRRRCTCFARRECSSPRLETRPSAKGGPARTGPSREAGTLSIPLQCVDPLEASMPGVPKPGRRAPLRAL